MTDQDFITFVKLKKYVYSGGKNQVRCNDPKKSLAL